MLPPLPRCSRWAYSSLKLTHPCQPSPKPLSGRPAHRPFRGLLGVHSRCGLHTRAVTKTVTVIRRLQTLRHLHACSGRFRLERSPGGACTRWKRAALSRRTRNADNLAPAQRRARPVAGKAIQGNACRRSHRRNATARNCRDLRLVSQPLLAGVPQINGTCSPRMAAAGPGRIGSGDASQRRCLALHNRASLRLRGPKPFCPCVYASDRIEPRGLA
jgi:hypothetical protein